LILSYNNLENLLELEPLKKLKKLDVSHNKIVSLGGLSSLKLQHLNIRNNCMLAEDSVNILQILADDLK
jgi:Leucine-rich repeat (LRR) protein